MWRDQAYLLDMLTAARDARRFARPKGSHRRQTAVPNGFKSRCRLPGGKAPHPALHGLPS